MTTYTTVQGDTWDLIAFKTLGSELLLNKLIDANPEHKSVVIFPSNVLLVIPDIETTSPILPPWKRGGNS